MRPSLSKLFRGSIGIHDSVNEGRGHEPENARWCKDEQGPTPWQGEQPLARGAVSGGLPERAHAGAHAFRRVRRQRAQLAHELLELALEIDRVSGGHRSSS